MASKQKKQPTLEQINALAEAISGVLNHPLTPPDLYDQLADGICELEFPQGLANSAEFIGACIAAHYGIHIDLFKKGKVR